MPIEALEGRTLLSGGTAADLIIQSATTPGLRSVTVVYDVVGAALGSPVSLRIDRAATASGTGGALRAMTIARATLAPAGLGLGEHSITVPIAGRLKIDPSHSYVRVVANGNVLANRLVDSVVSPNIPVPGPTKVTHHDVKGQARGRSVLEPAHLEKVAPSRSGSSTAGRGGIASSATSSSSATSPLPVGLGKALLDDENGDGKHPFATPYNQGSLADCGVNALAGAIDYLIATQKSLAGLKAQDFLPSRLFLYYNTLFAQYRGEPNAKWDNEPTVQSYAIHTAATQGMISEGSSTSDSTGETLPYGKKIVTPSAADYATSPLYRISDYQAFPNNATLADMKKTLNNNEVFTFWANAVNFPSNNSEWPGFQKGQLPMLPEPSKQAHQEVDGHFMLVVGYDDAKKAFIVRNSWGDNWGINGFAYMPYSYFTRKIPGQSYTWASPQYTVGGLTVTPPPTQLTSSLAALTSGKLGSNQGKVHIDTTPVAAAGTAAAFDFYNSSSIGQYVTPLVFSYNASTQTYTLKGIGKSILTTQVGVVGRPIVRTAGSMSLAPGDVFGFYDGKFAINQGTWAATGASATIPYVKTSGQGIWLTTGNSVPFTKLRIGSTFTTSTTNTSATHRLDVKLDNRVYSAMLVTAPAS